jgi:predicted Zn-ribbon and HTH transcriptional regulator
MKNKNRILLPPLIGDRGELLEILWKHATNMRGEETYIPCEEMDSIVDDILALQSQKKEQPTKEVNLIFQKLEDKGLIDESYVAMDRINEICDRVQAKEERLTDDMIKCSECGEYFKKKPIVIKGDEDTCDECLCPE